MGKGAPRILNPSGGIRSIQMTELRPPRAFSPSWLVILFWPHLGLIGSKPRAAHPAARSPGRMNWAKFLSSKC
eukprot:scaffold7125_cov118-Isochrysis_galbana.AAC.2